MDAFMPTQARRNMANYSSFLFAWVVTSEGIIASEVYLNAQGQVAFWLKADEEDLPEFEEVPVLALPKELFVEEEESSTFEFELGEIPVYRPDEYYLTEGGQVFITFKEEFKSSEAHLRDLAEMFLRNVYHEARLHGRAKAEHLASEVIRLYGDEIGLEAEMVQVFVEEGLKFNKSRKEKGLPPKRLREAPEEPPEVKRKKYESKPRRGGRWKRNQSNR